MVNVARRRLILTALSSPLALATSVTGLVSLRASDLERNSSLSFVGADTRGLTQELNFEALCQLDSLPPWQLSGSRREAALNALMQAAEDRLRRGFSKEAWRAFHDRIVAGNVGSELGLAVRRSTLNAPQLRPTQMVVGNAVGTPASFPRLSALSLDRGRPVSVYGIWAPGRDCGDRDVRCEG